MHRMKNLSQLIRYTLVLPFVTFILVSTPVQSMTVERAEELSARYTSKQFIDRLLGQFTLDDAHESVLREHFTVYYSNVKFLQKLFTEVEESKVAGGDPARAVVQNLSARWMYGGLRLIPYEQQLHYFTYMRNLMEVVSPSECRFLITGASTEKLQNNQSIEIKYFNAVEVAILKNYLQMQRVALESFVSGVALQQEISNEQREIAKQSIAAELNVLLSQHRSSDELKEVWRDGGRATDAQACELGKVVMEVFLRGDSDTNRLQVQHYLERYTYKE